ncbi:MAG: hypothetical protein WBG92_23505 [Thiohalocapsa sp.]
MPDQPFAAPHSHIAFPFCGLGCDDLSPARRKGRIAVDARDCDHAEVNFGIALSAPETSPRIAGVTASLDKALHRVGALLDQSNLPLFAGLSGDLVDIRGALRLAARSGGAIDHRNGAALISSLSVLEERGWIVTSLGETRNRADLVVLVGNGLTKRFPRLKERILAPKARLHAEIRATVVEIRTAGESTDPSVGKTDETALNPQPGGDISLRPGQLRDFIAVLRSRLSNRTLDSNRFPDAELLAERLKTAAYPVIAFAASDLQSEPHPDLAVRALADMVRQLNQSGRAALLPLGGADGETSAHQASAWHTGFSVRQTFHAGVPKYEPRRGDTRRMLDSGGADLLVWISTLSDQPPPDTTVPTLVLGHPAMRLEREPDVFVPLAVPGVHRAGAVHRGDGLALLPLSAIVENKLPESGAVFARLLELVAETEQPC